MSADKLQKITKRYKLREMDNENEPVVNNAAGANGKSPFL